MKNIQIVLAFLFCGSFYLTIAQKSEVTSFKIEVKVDPGIELFSTIFRLAGLPEYHQNELPEYINDIELYFNSFKYHPVVKFARQLDTTVGMGYNAPMELAVQTGDIEWLQFFFGPTSNTQFFVLIGMQNGANNYASNIVAEIDELRAAERKKWAFIETNAPKILSMIPENGAKDVDPNLREIRITFDCPMQSSSYSMIMYGSSDHYPEIIGEIRFDSTKTKCFIPVKLKPDKHYIFGLNSEYSMAFRDENNNPLIPVTVKFKTY